MGAFQAASGYVLGGMTPGVAATLAIAGAAALTGLYLLRLRRRRVVVPFAALWLPHAGERRSEALARRLRRWISLAAQLVMFSLILLAASDPRPAGADRAGRSIVLLIDRSASMSAIDEPGSRLAAARARAEALIAGLGAADRAMVASFAAGVGAESGFEADPVRLRRAAAAVTPSEEPADLGRALAFAAAVLRDRPRPTVVVISDGAFSDDARRTDLASLLGPERAPGGPALDVRFAPVGRRARNVGILGFAARRYPADPASVEVALTVQNFGAAAVEVGLEITAGRERTPVERVHLSLASGERRRHLVPDVAAPDSRLEARLFAEAGQGRGPVDDLALDDRAFAVVPGRARLRVLRIGPPNLYLDGALLSLGQGVTVRRAGAAAAEATRASWPLFDAVILDGVAPAPAPTRGHFLYLDPHGPGSPFAERGTVREPAIADARRAHPLLRHLDLADINIAEARRLALGPGDVAVASSFSGPLVIARERPGLREAALAFDVRRSDLPMRAAFPLLISNALSWLAESGLDAREEGAGPALTGSTARLPAPQGADAVEVAGPAGDRAIWPAVGGAAEVPITRVGFYRLGGRGAAPAAGPPSGELTFAANLGDPVESNTAPATTLTLGGRALRPPDPPARRRGRPLGLLALVAAVVLLLIEWWSYHRRWTV
jgi:von Willebrand factor type A domain/Aerotolerance regulator N-terminal